MADQELFYRVVEPRAGEGPHPALVMLHGRGADEVDLLDLASLLDPRLLVVSVRAPFALGPGYHWYTLYRIGEFDVATFTQSLGLLRQLRAELPKRLPIDPNRIFGLGFSQGAVMTASLRLSDPTAWAGSIMLSGYVPPAEVLAPAANALQGAEFFLAHGLYDEVIPIDFAHRARETLQAAGVNLEYHEYPMAHQIAMPELEALNTWLAARL